MEYIVTKRVSINSLSTKMADSWNLKASCADISKFLLYAVYEELNLIHIMTYIHPLQMMIKTLRVQMGSKTLTRVPTDEIASEKTFSHYVSSFSFTIYQCQVSIVVRKKNIKQTIFRLFVKFMYQDQSACIHRPNYYN